MLLDGLTLTFRRLRSITLFQTTTKGFLLHPTVKLFSQSIHLIHLSINTQNSRGEAPFRCIYSQPDSIRVIVGEFAFNKRKLYVPVIHLTSDRNTDQNNPPPLERRLYQVSFLTDSVLTSAYS
jgi:hypothetical protein